MQQGITVSVHYLFNPGMEVVGRQMLQEFVSLNRAYEGCRDIAIHRDIKNPASLMTISHWDSLDAFMLLLNEPRVKEAAEQGKQILAKPFKVRIWESINEG